VHEGGESRWAPPDDSDLSHVHYITDDLAGWLEKVRRPTVLD
jgi:hypothetical protein